ncbi:hypothetical protein NCS57_01191100 [Fusarium keratoplasticum]|uniref:Uncharacterized protein n=1 Tax=Fusarium keratoplasticum TaxID=1328300 RepID=A0ACC0QJP4_9HYPO|nr:hypothetical protein NCS57_01191100 [Fusarium keratoplasticum]KAI8654457.1 hypothetical protein NCS57_01191100 [Fusarium keratoplasticum]
MGFGNPRPAAILASQWTLIVVATAVIAARVYLRLKIQNRRMLNSDIIMCTAWVFAIITAAFGPVFARMGALEPDVHTSLQGYKGELDDLELVLQLFFAVNFPFYTTFYLCKAALLAVYLQVFPEFMVKRRIFLWATILFVVIAYVVTITLIFTICLPLERNWEISVQKSCPGSSYAILFQVGWGLHFLGDLLVFILPWLILPALNVKRALRLGIYFTFLLGTINIAVCLVRFIAIQQAGEDYSISLSTIVLWSSLDVNVVLVIACLPSLRPYFDSRGSSGYLAENTLALRIRTCTNFSTTTKRKRGRQKISNFRYSERNPSLETAPRNNHNLTHGGCDVSQVEKYGIANQTVRLSGGKKGGGPMMTQFNRGYLSAIETVVGNASSQPLSILTLLASSTSNDAMRPSRANIGFWLLWLCALVWCYLNSIAFFSKKVS